MKKKIGDYLFLYLGNIVQVQTKRTGNVNAAIHYLTGKMVDVNTNGINHTPWIVVRFETVEKIYRNGDNSSSDMHHFFIGYDEIKLVLRPLSDMKREEACEYAGFYNKRPTPIPDDAIVTITPKEDCVHINIEKGGSGVSLFPGGPHGDKAEAFRYMLSKGFDLFGLIEADLAIDQTTLK